MPEHVVEQGDCISSIAFDNGFFPEKIWDDSKNAALKDLRKDPNILQKGDVVHIPEKIRKEESEATDKNLKYKLKGVPAKLLLKFKYNNGEVMKGAHYDLNIKNKISKSAYLSSQGILEEEIPPDATSAVVKIFDRVTIDGCVYLKEFEFRFRLGYLDPIDTESGIKSRIAGLGLKGNVDHDQNGINQNLIRAFQKKYDIKPIDGNNSTSFRRELKGAFGR